MQSEQGFKIRQSYPHPKLKKQSAGDPSQVSKLNAEIKQAEAEMKETMKEVQKAASESVGGGSEKAQMLQSKILLQQQEIMTNQLQIKSSSVTDTRPRLDLYESEQADAKTPDNVYHLEEKDGVRQIVFNQE